MAMSKKMLMIVAVIAVVAIIAIAAAALSGGNNNAANDNDENDTEMTASNSAMSATVSDVIVGTNTTATGTDTYLPLDAGHHFVVVKFNVTAKGSDGSAPALFWKLYTSDGQIQTIDFSAKSTYPDGLQAGATAPYVLVYAVPDAATPTKLVYNGITDLEIALA